MREASPLPDGNSFRSLTPNDAIDLSHYREALDHVFSSNEIRNIALTGSYGSGKSSVIRSYEKANGERTFLHISLARFEEQGQAASDSADRTKTVNVLEGKIINQLIHQIPEKDIPQGYIPSHDKTPWYRHLWIVLGILAVCILGIYVFQFPQWASVVGGLSESWISPLLLATTNPYGRLIGMGLLLVLLGSGLFYILRTYPFRILFKKVDLKGLVGIELFSAEEDTYFDKYLYDVLHWFDQANADAIVFEDLDRYDVTLIFEKLREINDLAYSREKRGLRSKKKPLRFFYLIRDDVFTASDRSKFFDFIIPVVPYVDASNSCDQLLQQFTEAGFVDRFSKRFLQDVSLYLGDMRLVSNIVNEYIIYQGRLSGSGLATKPDRQLAIVIYKNLYPGDFDLLQKGRGYVYALFEQKKALIEVKKGPLDSRIQELRRRLDDAKAETLKSVDELNALYFPLSESEITINDSGTSGLDRVELVRRILQKPDAVRYADYKESHSYYSSGYERTIRPLNVVSKRADMEANENYKRKKKHIEDQNIQKQGEILEDIRRLEETRAMLSTMNLCELLQDISPDLEESFWSPPLPSYEEGNYLTKIQTNKNFGLLKYLIRNGYIEENYAAYISYFYPNSLTARDRNFLLSITDRAPLEYDYHLDRPDAVLDRLEEVDFSRRETRNFDLFAHLLRTKGPSLSVFLRSGSTDNGAYPFFASFWRTGRRSTRSLRLIRILSQEHPEWFRIWCESGGILLEGEWRPFILDALYFLSEDDLGHINQEQWLTKRISDDRDFLQLDHPNIRRLIPALKTLQIQFCRVDYREEDVSLVREILCENLYVLNLPMLKTAMAVFWDISPAEVEKRSYSQILCHSQEPLSLRVLGDMGGYANAILHECDARFSDDETAAIHFLNCEELSDTDKIEYIQRLDTTVEDINAVTTHTLWPALMENQRVAYTWQNMADFYAEVDRDTDALPPELTSFIDSGSGPINWGFIQLNQRIGDQASKLRGAVLTNRDISLEHYRTALKGMGFSYQNSSFPFLDIPEDRMRIVLDLGIVPVTEGNVEVIRDHYLQLWNDFVLPKGTPELVRLMDTSKVQLTETELASLLEDPRMDDKTAEEMLFIFSKPVSLKNKTFSEAVRACIVEGHLYTEEIPLLLKSFAKEPFCFQAAFLDYTRENPNFVFCAAESIRFIPMEVYAALLKLLTEDQLLTLRPYLENPDFESVCIENRQPKFPDTQEVRAILNAFQSYHWISSWKVKKGKIIAYPTRK